MTTTTPLASDARNAISALLGSASVDTEDLQRLSFHGTAPAFESPHRLSLAAASAIGAYALTIENWWHLASGQHQSIAIDWMQAACSLNPGEFQTQSGYALPALSLLTELKADFYKTADERWFFPIGSYPHLRDGVLELLDCANTPGALASAISRWKAEELETAFAERRLPGAYARTRTEWLDHAQGQLLAQLPVIEITRIGDSDPELPRPSRRPLDSIRVLDLGHVIAGPIVARTLAEHGADVLRVGAPTWQDPFRQTVDTNIGKRSAFLDFDRARDLDQARALIAGADVVVQSWRPGSMEGRGLGAASAAGIRPGVVYVSVSAYGDEGPWAERGGFEQLGQTVSGIAASEGGSGRPRVVPTYLLNDYLTGYLGAAGAMLALLRRAREGGSYHVKVSLTRTSMWVQELGLEAPWTAPAQRAHFAQALRPALEARQSAYGLLEQLRPVAGFSRTPAGWSLPPAPNGAHPPLWI